MILIGLSGKIGTGKNYIAENIIPKILSHKYIPIYLAFADQIKVEAAIRHKDIANYETLYVEKTKEVREMLQKHGTEVGRTHDANIWINAMDIWLKIHSNRFTCQNKIPIFIITDVRFKNEADYIKNLNGLLIRIDAPKRNTNKILLETNGDEQAIYRICNHKSETDLDDYLFDSYILNDDIEDYKLIQSIKNTFIINGFENLLKINIEKNTYIVMMIIMIVLMCETLLYIKTKLEYYFI